MRLLSRHLPEFGWLPTVLTVEPSSDEGPLDAELLNTVPKDLRVVRVPVLPVRISRWFRVGDLGIRAIPGLLRACHRLLSSETFHCFFVTIYPTYPALLGPFVKRRFSVPFVLDYQDPWVGSWGLTTGPSASGRPDLKSRLSRALASRLEPVAFRAADAVTAVSAETFRAVRERYPDAFERMYLELPIGGEASDFEYLQNRPQLSSSFDSDDGNFHLSYVGTLLPAGRETLRAFLMALSLLKQRQPRLYSRLRVHFIGTSNQAQASDGFRVLLEAEALLVADVVEETPARVAYMNALATLVASDAILLLGSSESHYTASKLYPALLARRPLLAIFHERSSVVTVLRAALSAPAARLVTYDDTTRATGRVEDVYQHLRALVESPVYDPSSLDTEAVEALSARSLARRLAEVFAYADQRVQK